MFPLGMLAAHSRRGLIRFLLAPATNCLTTLGCALARIAGCALARMHMVSACLWRLQGFMPRGWALARRQWCFLAAAVAVMVLSLRPCHCRCWWRRQRRQVPCCHGKCVAANEATTTPGWSLCPTLEVHLPVQGLEVGPQASASGKSSSEYRVLRRRNFSEIAWWKSITM